jgi:hypothetical protein
MEHHNHIEESVFFPALQKLSSVPDGLLETPVSQHAAIHEGLVKLLSYATSNSKQFVEYRWITMKDVIDSFASELNEYLTRRLMSC